MPQESYIQYLSGYSKSGVILEDIKTTLTDLQNMDEEHGAFWVSLIKAGKQCKDLIEIQNLYSLLLEEDFVGLKNQLQIE